MYLGKLRSAWQAACRKSTSRLVDDWRTSQLVKRIYLLCDLSMTPMQVSIGHHIIRWPETGLNQDIADMAVSFLGCSCFDSNDKAPQGTVAKDTNHPEARPYHHTGL